MRLNRILYDNGSNKDIYEHLLPFTVSWGRSKIHFINSRTTVIVLIAEFRYVTEAGEPMIIQALKQLCLRPEDGVNLAKQEEGGQCLHSIP
ncbi:hypothetical protein HII26_05505 [Paenibacillus aquistagni]|nr:hypothetical protein [Paenibacillus aquistagni]